MRLTADLILQSRAFYNPLKERELDLRGLKIPTIENLGAAEDQFDTIDLSDNSITKVENLPKFNRLKTIILNNNRVIKIDDNLGNNLDHVETLIHILLNEIEDLEEIAHLKEWKLLNILYNSI
ncbi:hypothetical protein WA158_000903 [Blastocystis sp. Blastoise]